VESPFEKRPTHPRRIVLKSLHAFGEKPLRSPAEIAVARQPTGLQRRSKRAEQRSQSSSQRIRVPAVGGTLSTECRRIESGNKTRRIDRLRPSVRSWGRFANQLRRHPRIDFNDTSVIELHENRGRAAASQAWSSLSPTRELSAGKGYQDLGGNSWQNKLSYP
jgi:hypothetical protein